MCQEARGLPCSRWAHIKYMPYPLLLPPTYERGVALAAWSLAGFRMCRLAVQTRGSNTCAGALPSGEVPGPQALQVDRPTTPASATPPGHAQAASSGDGPLLMEEDGFGAPS